MRQLRDRIVLAIQGPKLQGLIGGTKTHHGGKTTASRTKHKILNPMGLLAIMVYPCSPYILDPACLEYTMRTPILCSVLQAYAITVAPITLRVVL